MTGEEPWVPRLVREHPGLLLTAGYVLLTVAGLSYEFWFFRDFRITIVEYVETSDFLLAALREPLVIVLAFLPLLLVWFFDRLGVWMRAKYPRYRRWEDGWAGWWYTVPAARRTILGFLVLSYAFLFIEMYAKRLADRIKAGQGREVGIELVAGAPPSSRALLLGTTAKFVFVYLPAEKKTHIIPIENVSRLVISSEEPAVLAPSPPERGRGLGRGGTGSNLSSPSAPTRPRPSPGPT